MPLNSFSLNHFRQRLGHVESLPQLVVLGLLCGLFTGLIILAFRYSINWPLSQFLPGGDPENFESLPAIWRFFLPIIGSALIALIFMSLKYEHVRVGVPHVLERLSYHQGQLPLINAVVQFFAGALSLIFGHSAGREGPAVHLGAASGSLMGQWLRLPNNSIRMLVGCGTAAAISASFNTPIAGVIFAMEVVMMEYSVIGFLPVMIASVTSALLIQLTIGGDPAFYVPPLQLAGLHEIPFILLLGVTTGLLSILFIFLALMSVKHIKLPMVARLLLAGVLTGTLAIYYPQIMGLGYDTVADTLIGNISLQILLGLTLAKLIATAVGVGLGQPMGLIGPTLFIGACAGAAVGYGANSWVDLPSDIGFYAMLGMGAMMGAVLQAPLAALMATLELTQNPSIIFSAMIAIVTASLTCRHFYPRGSIFQAALEVRGLDWRRAPMDQILERAGVTSRLRKNYSLQRRVINQDEALSLLAAKNLWIMITDAGAPRQIMPLTDLKVFLEQSTDDQQQEIDLLEIPALRQDLTSINRKATLKEALALMDELELDVLYVVDDRMAPLGILTRNDIMSFFTDRHEL